MSLIKTVKEKIAENATLKDIKHIIKRQKEGKALANFNRYAEELIVKKMHTAGKTLQELAAFTTDKANHFELKWNEKRLAKVLGQKAPKAEKKAAEPKAELAPAAPVTEPAPTTEPATPAAPATEPAPAVAEEETKKKRRKKK